MRYKNPQQFRLRCKTDISRVFAEGQCKRDKRLQVRALKNDRPDRPARMAVAVAKRLGNAVMRNRIKRILREVIRHQRPHLRNGLDIVIMPQRADLSLEKATVSVERLTEKLALRRPAEADE